MRNAFLDVLRHAKVGASVSPSRSHKFRPLATLTVASWTGATPMLLLVLEVPMVGICHWQGSKLGMLGTLSSYKL